MDEGNEPDPTAATRGDDDSFDTSERKLKALLEGSDLPQDAPRNVIGEVVAQTYELVAELGAGGMGEVFLARHQRTGGEVALKLIKATRLGDDSFVRRFELEAKHTASLNHPNIVRVFDYGQDGDLVYLAMEYVKGDSLDLLIAKDDGLSVESAVRVTEQILLALEAAHEEGLIHRDIKPPNILVTGYGTDQFVKVLDFGIARALEGEGADTQGAIGSPSSMAPEQFEGGEVSAATDLYALGCTVHAMISGKPPFSGPYWKLATLHCIEPAPRLAGVPSDFADWVLTLLEKSPADRPQSARAALESLRAIDLAEPDSATAEPPPVPEVEPDPEPEPEAEAEPRTTSNPLPVRSNHRTTIVIVGVLLIAGIGLIAANRADRPERSPQAPPSKPEASKPVIDRPLSMRPVDEIQSFAMELAPDGKRLLYYLDRTLEIANIDDSVTTPVPLPTNADLYAVTWHPDGERLVVGAQLGEAREPCVYLLTLQGQMEEVLCDVLAATYSPDSTRLAMITDEGLTLALADGSERRSIGAVVGFPRWLSDGSAVLYAAGGEAGYEVRITTPDGSQTLLPDVGVNSGMNEVVYAALPDRGVAWRDGDELWVGRIDEQLAVIDRRKVATSDGFQFARLSTGSDGQRLAYCRSVFQADVQLGAWNGATLTRLKPISPTSVSEHLVGWTPDGRVYFTSNRSKKAAIYEFDPATERVVEVVASEHRIAGGETAGAHLVFFEHDDEAVRLVSFVGGVRKTVATLDPDTSADIRCRPEGDWCLLHTAKEKFTIRRIDLATGELSEPLLERPMQRAADTRRWDFAPNDDLLAWTQWGSSEIEVYSTKTWERQHTITVPSTNVQHLRWTQAEALLATTGGAAPFGIYLVGKDGSWKTLLEAPAWLSRPIPSPGGDRLAWTEMSFQCTPWIMDLPK